MILFQSVMTIKDLQKKSFRKKDGGLFEFHEGLFVTDEKKPTTLVVRVDDDMMDVIAVGLKAEFQIGISSYEGKDGRVWNNFILVNKKDMKIVEEQPRQPLETNFDGDEIPF